MATLLYVNYTQHHKKEIDQETHWILKGGTRQYTQENWQKKSTNSKQTLIS